jgi:hypothetical protein
MFKRFPGYDFCTGAIIILTLLSQSTEARAWSDDTFEEYLAAGKWSVTADDNQSGETLPYATVERIVRRYCEAPGNADARENVGILASPWVRQTGAFPIPKNCHPIQTKNHGKAPRVQMPANM